MFIIGTKVKVLNQPSNYKQSFNYGTIVRKTVEKNYFVVKLDNSEYSTVVSTDFLEKA